MAFTQTETFNLIRAAKAMHSINIAENRLQGIGLIFDGERTGSSIGHNLYAAMDNLSEIFLTHCKVYLLDTNTHDLTGKSLGTTSAENALRDLMHFIETEDAESDTEIIQFADEMKRKYAAAYKQHKGDKT